MREIPSNSRLLMFTLLSSAGKFSRAPTAENIGQQQKQTKTEETRAIKTAAGILEYFGLRL